MHPRPPNLGKFIHLSFPSLCASTWPAKTNFLLDWYCFMPCQFLSLSISLSLSLSLSCQGKWTAAAVLWAVGVAGAPHASRQQTPAHPLRTDWPPRLLLAPDLLFSLVAGQLAQVKTTPDQTRKQLHTCISIYTTHTHTHTHTLYIVYGWLSTYNYRL